MVNPFILQIIRSEFLSRYLPDTRDPDRLYAEVLAQGLAPALYLLNRSSRILPDPIAKFAQEAYRDALLFKDLCLCKLMEMSAALAACGRVVIIKGLALCEKIYVEPAVRPMADVDLYFPDGSIADVRSILMHYGFAPYGSYTNEFFLESLHVDLHEDLWGIRRNPLRRHIVSGIAESFVPSTLVPGFFIPSPQLLAAHAAFHSLKHGLSRKIWLMDLYRLHRAGYFDTYANNAPQFVSYVLDYLDRLGLGGETGSPRSKTGQIRFQLVSTVLAGGSTRPVGELALALLCPSPLHAFAYLKTSLVPRKQILGEMYGNDSYCRLLARRLARLAGCGKGTST
jgi:Uncharacterised nucleotidyltransferase